MIQFSTYMTQHRSYHGFQREITWFSPRPISYFYRSKREQMCIIKLLDTIIMICKCLRAQPYYNILVFYCVIWLFASQSAHRPLTRPWIFAFFGQYVDVFRFFWHRVKKYRYNIYFWQRSTERYPHFYDLLSGRSGLKFRNIPVLRLWISA